MINAAVRRVPERSLWDLATCSRDGEPNVVPVTFKGILDGCTLTVGDVFLETTLRNLEENGGRIAISVYDAAKFEGYQIKGTAVHVTEGKVVDEYRAMVEKMFSGAATAKGALIITPEKVIVTSPGPSNKKEL
ncbi:MAG: pyridoxamine 5'-phosphate oxidase family protein [Succinivibrionaceae bacterium]|jgi:predicted pyridoxine 5'-phosphate oxidase superfamily flavin-nucleotide-binding protein|nr:pyridoxamine 5'-phosphate oxidase family protein [Succinivibrionaceae bacterium]MCI6199849.1 pyridoxamine 5'-phosphate oxidase family protein [Pseudomonadota bacterium]MDY6274410.1 pyridoxamine 5'-phosphate oxidase family protein [Succinivibrionaceae bacterium]MDY6375970.1 pyridoxamine 5'-phosphate oxidase family protein [Succinivibrionaceae bacterium]